MSKTKSDTTTASTTRTATTKAMFQTEMQKNFDKELSQGFRGTEVDKTDNFNYTVAGVTSGAPTPETKGAK